MNTDLNGSLPAWVLMWLITAGVFFCGKFIILIISPTKPNGWRLFAFLFLWVGMDEKKWIKPRQEPIKSSYAFVKAIVKIVIGGLLLWFVTRQFTHPILAGWCGMVGVIFLLHFGLFDVLAIFWQKMGIAVGPIMVAPALATSLTDFWGRRWNIAFRDLAHIFIFKPCSLKFGAKIALCISFIFSGILHELLISIPAGGGYGLPTCYFFLQAIGILLEKYLFKNVEASEKTFMRWLLTHSFTVLPAYLLFHPRFIENVMIPFFQTIGALP